VLAVKIVFAALAAALALRLWVSYTRTRRR
jgi:hypothetical protein